MKKSSACNVILSILKLVVYSDTGFSVTKQFVSESYYNFSGLFTHVDIIVENYDNGFRRNILTSDSVL